MLGDVPMLPLSFPNWGFVAAVGGGDGLACVGRGGLRMSGHMGRRGSMPGGASGRDRGGTLSLPRGGMRGEGELPGLDHCKLTCCPGASGLNRLARSVITRMLVLEVRQHMLRAVSGPQRQCPVVLLVVQPHVSPSFRVNSLDGAPVNY